MPTSTSKGKSAATAKPSNGRRYAMMGGSLAILLLIGGAWWYFRTDPNVARMRELRSQLADDTKMTDDQRRQIFTEMREVGQRLTEQQRQQLWAEGGDQFRGRMMREIDNYFELPVKERKAYLDEQIKRMEDMRRNFARNDGQRGDGQRGGGGGGPGGPGGWGGRGNRGGDGETSRRRAMLDNTTPEQREKFTQYMQDMSARRKELGLPPMGPPFGRPGGRPRG